MEAQSIALEYETLLQKQWAAMLKAQRLLGGQVKTNERPLNQTSQEGPRRNHGSAIDRARVRNASTKTMARDGQGAKVAGGRR